MRGRFVLLFGFVGVLLFAGVSLAKVSLTFMTPLGGPDGAFMDQIVQRFNSEHPDIEVTHLVVVDSVDYKMKLSTGIASGTAPQIILIRKYDIGEYLDQLHGFDPAVLLSRYGIDIKDVYPQVLEGLQVGGLVRGIPLDVWLMYLAYNRAHFRSVGLDPNAPPRDRTEFINALEKLRSIANPAQGKYPFAGEPAWAWRWMNWVYQFGGDILSPDLRRAAFEQAGVQAIRFQLELMDRGLFSPSHVSGETAFPAGLSSVYIWGVWTLGTFQKALGADFGAAPVPQVGTVKAVWGGSHIIALPEVMVKDPRVLDAAMSFVRYLWEHALDWYAAGQTPSRMSIAQSVELRQRLPYIYTIAQQLPYAKLMPTVPVMAEIQSEIQVYLDRALLNKDMTPEAAMREAASAVNEILDDYWASR